MACACRMTSWWGTSSVASSTWGGARPGAGRKRTTLRLSMPPIILAQYEQVAQEEGVPLEEVVREALLSWLAERDSQLDSQQARKSPSAAPEGQRFSF